jgi:hypothetical protein
MALNLPVYKQGVCGSHHWHRFFIIDFSNGETIELSDVQFDWKEQGIPFSWTKFVKDYDVNQDHPIIVERPG